MYELTEIKELPLSLRAGGLYKDAIERFVKSGYKYAKVDTQGKAHTTLSAGFKKAIYDNNFKDKVRVAASEADGLFLIRKDLD